MRTLMRRVLKGLFGAFLMLFAAQGWAVAKDLVLNEDAVHRLLSSLPEMEAIAVTEGLRARGEAKQAGNPLLAVLKVIASGKLQNEAEAVAVKHGFASLEEWVDTGRAVGQAYIYLTGKPTGGIDKAEVDKHEAEAAKEIDKLGFLSAKQKDKLKEQLDKAASALKHEPPKENVAVVEAMRPEIEAAVQLPGN